MNNQNQDNMTDLELKALAIIRAEGEIDESELLKRLFPEPAYPTGQSEAAIAQWRDDFQMWKDRAYGSDEIEYRDCYCGIASQATINLRKAGEIRTVNNGYNCYTFIYTGKRMEKQVSQWEKSVKSNPPKRIF